jgi:peptidoglycan biosynthesis protein MviN/MurJ (putative lipid II flippase)
VSRVPPEGPGDQAPDERPAASELRSVLYWTAMLASAACLVTAVLLEPRQGLGTMAAAGVAAGNLLLAARRIRRAGQQIEQQEKPDHQVATARLMAAGALRWGLSLAALWWLLERFHPAAIATGLGCVVAAITLHAILAFVRAERRPTAGADP